MRGNRGILENLGILTAGQVSAQLLNVWALVFLADRLGAHWFGVVQVGVAFMGYALVVAEGGMFAFGIREVSRLDDSRTVFDYAGRHAAQPVALSRTCRPSASTASKQASAVWITSASSTGLAEPMASIPTWWN